jgi:hypothetical protein
MASPLAETPFDPAGIALDLDQLLEEIQQNRVESHTGVIFALRRIAALEKSVRTLLGMVSTPSPHRGATPMPSVSSAATPVPSVTPRSTVTPAAPSASATRTATVTVTPGQATVASLSQQHVRGTTRASRRSRSNNPAPSASGGRGRPTVAIPLTASYPRNNLPD